MMHPKRDSLKDQDLQGLVRLCGKSFLYLPPEYAPGSLILPTCFRATAQHLVHSETRGVFRIPGSVRVVNELYEFYCAHQAGGDVANTVRSPNLPSHINAGIHDVASLFKKFLAGLPGGILGSLSLFDALVAINSQLYTDPEFSRTKQSKLRARLIALAVGTLRSQYRRELICAVFGLLCLLGRAAETAPREDESGRPLPTSDLMGYSALGIVFGPLLIGDMLGSHSVKLADPSSGLFLVPVSPQPKSKKEKKKAKESTNEPPQPFWDVDKVHVANDITEMLITNWRDVVKQMRNLDGALSILRHRSRASISEDSRRVRSFTRPSEDVFTHQKSVETSEDRPPSPAASSSRAVSFKQTDRTSEALSVKKTRQIPARSASNLTRGSNLGVLSPPREESGGENQEITTSRRTTPLKSSLRPISRDIVTTLMDGAADILLTGNMCRGSFRDLKDQFEGRQIAIKRPSSYPIWKTRSKAQLRQHNDAHIQGQKPSLTTPQEASPISAISSRGDSKRGAGKVMNLAAKQELSSKNEEYAKLRLEFEQNRKASQVSEILLREDLDRARADLAKWKRRAERAEYKVESFERMATRAQEIRALSAPVYKDESECKESS
ncbi:hypothetical protein SLS64_010662 [Diaporthe eres]